MRYLIKLNVSQDILFSFVSDSCEWDSIPRKYSQYYNDKIYYAGQERILDKTKFLQFCKKKCCEDFRCKNFDFRWPKIVAEQQCYLSYTYHNEAVLKNGSIYITYYRKLEGKIDVLFKNDNGI